MSKVLLPLNSGLIWAVHSFCLALSIVNDEDGSKDDDSGWCAYSQLVYSYLVTCHIIRLGISDGKG